MYRRNDPRLRRALNELSQTFESANESAQANIFTFSQNYVDPCVAGLRACFKPCATCCYPPKDVRVRRSRGRSVGRPEQSFDFYDDWEDDEADALFGLGDTEYDSLLRSNGNYGTTTQPARQRGMSYGTRTEPKAKRKTAQPYEEGEETDVPGSSYFGFFGKLTGKMGGKMLKYKPSAADLQERPARGEHRSVIDDLLEEEEDDSRTRRKRRHGRSRSDTDASRETADSLSSRGDIFPSDNEDDAVPLDDEFAMVLERRTTNSGRDESAPARTKRPSAGSRNSTHSSRSVRKSKRSSRATSGSPTREANVEADPTIVPVLRELQREEEQAQAQEETEIAQRREAAQKLAMDRGLEPGESTNAQRSPRRESTAPTSPSEMSQDYSSIRSPLSRMSSDSATRHNAEQSPSKLRRLPSHTSQSSVERGASEDAIPPEDDPPNEV